MEQNLNCFHTETHRTCSGSSFLQHFTIWKVPVFNIVYITSPMQKLCLTQPSQLSCEMVLLYCFRWSNVILSWGVTSILFITLCMYNGDFKTVYLCATKKPVEWKSSLILLMMWHFCWRFWGWELHWVPCSTGLTERRGCRRRPTAQARQLPSMSWGS